MEARTPASGDPVSEAQRAVSALRASGWAHPAGAAAIRELLELQRYASSVGASVEAALAALDAGALPLLTAAVRESARAAGGHDEAAVEACSQACGVICGLLERTRETTHVVEAIASVPEWRSAADALAEALAACGSLSAKLAGRACSALAVLCERGVYPGSDELAAAAGRGAAEMLAVHASTNDPLDVTWLVAMLARALLIVTPRWPAARATSAATAFIAAGGLEAVFTALEAPCNNKTLKFLLGLLVDALPAAPPERIARLSASGECYGALARVLRRTSLPPDGRLNCLFAARFMAGQDASAHAHLARSGLLDAAAACLQHDDVANADPDSRNRLLNACLLVITLAARSGSVPADLGAALRALSQLMVAGPPCKTADSCGAALAWLCKCPGAADTACAVGVPARLLAALGACDGAPGGCTCANVLIVLGFCADGAPRDVLRAGAVSAAVRVLQSHARDGKVTRMACVLLSTLSKTCKFDATDDIGAADGWRPLMAALREHGVGDAVLAIHASGVLIIGTQRLDSRNAAAGGGAVPAITAAMRAHDSISELQRRGMCILGTCATVDVELADLLAAVRAVVDGMARHAADVAVQSAACFALKELCTLDHSSLRMVDAVVAAGAPAAMLAALRTHAGREELMLQVLHALGGLLIADSWPSEGVTWLDCRAALIAHIAVHGCPVRNGQADTVFLRLAARSFENTHSQGPAPPGAVAAMCVALREALKLHTDASVERQNREMEFTSLTTDAGIALSRLVSAPGAARAAISADAFAAGAVELLAAAAAHAAHPEGGDTELHWSLACASAFSGLVVLSAGSPAAACRAAACGVHSLADACKRANAFAGQDEYKAPATTLARRVRTLVAAHEDSGGCAVPECDLRLMSKRRCCLHDCDAAADAPLKLCGGCRRAAFCCAAHQRQAWPCHKEVCKTRAVVEAARSKLLAHADSRQR